ncbi:alpha/beta hydrolase family protein [Flavihumibacter profundi]|uniref:alpha/beta hydrolase family protein n=1 Tax=Flavihumibacter profundi TaxID=2716883 RepID=UPI001CC41AAA|nr:prolyl oligopeptidase family serine peptidase [Flavihumibacter profundi]MBZ5855719.1 prolyl oligopeptidase family serine peptidase [Flavihumibacter profundi]
MKNSWILLAWILSASTSTAQKKPLDHSVYDQWQSLGEKLVSANGRYIVYTINVQEGDGELVVRSANLQYEKHIPRGYQAVISDDSRFLVAKIKPLFKETREAMIKKSATADMPKDSLLILELGKDSLRKIAQLKSFKLPERGDPWLAVQLWKSPVPGAFEQADSIARLDKMLSVADSLNKAADSIRRKAGEARQYGMEALKPKAIVKKENKSGAESIDEGNFLLVKNLVTGKEYQHELVSSYLFNKFGQVLIIQTTKSATDKKRTGLFLRQNLQSGETDTVMKNFQDVRGVAISEDAKTLAFIAERDSSAKALKKYYKLWMYRKGMDSAVVWAERHSAGVPEGYIIHPDFNNYFSQDGSRLFIGLAPQPPVKDTSLVDFETAKLDVWNYRDDYLQPQQLVQLKNDLKSSWLAVLRSDNGLLIKLGGDSCELVFPSAEGNGQFAMGLSTRGYRIQQQWTQHLLADLYVIDLATGLRKLVAKRVFSNSASISPAGKYIIWYDPGKKQWIAYSTGLNKTLILSKGIPYPLFDEEDDHPDDPPPYGIMGWMEQDEFVYLYDRYDIWKADPGGMLPPLNITMGKGRKNKVIIRYSKTVPDEKFLTKKQSLLFHLFDEKTKGEGWQLYTIGGTFSFGNNGHVPVYAARFSDPVKARDNEVLIFRQQTPEAQNLYLSRCDEISDSSKSIPLSQLNKQQSGYNWFSVELHRWKMLDGKMSEGLLYKPENFDPLKKYPVIFYFYERNSENRYNYIEPMPVRASINIAYYTSNGYLVFDPDIYYKTGQPGEDAYNSVVSAARYLSRFAWVDTARMGLQGHSWGGYQVAYLVTRTNMFAAAEAGAPVSNMTSAYGGIRWGTGISRQFQYEKTQSRLGATLWEKPERYLKNSPLFRANKIQTPLLLLHNDKDDAVPWYQGIELFSALRRLGKEVWLVSYNDELHGIIERRNRKDWTIRMAQFFNHYLKEAPAPKWMTEGVPATRKGIEWGLGY